MMTDKLMPACGTDLAMMIDTGHTCTLRFTLWDGSVVPVRILQNKLRIEGAGSTGKHG